MNRNVPPLPDHPDQLGQGAEETGAEPEETLWFLPGLDEDEPDDLPLRPLGESVEMAAIGEWSKAEAGNAARLARVAGRLGALDERLRTGPEGWRHRLALIEAAELSWFAGDRVAPDRLALWVALRVSSVRDDARALARAGWAVRRLTGGPGPENGLSDFLGRRDPGTGDTVDDSFVNRAESWQTLMHAAADLHPITRACMGFHLWALAGLGRSDDGMEAAVTAARIAAGDGRGAVFAALAMGGAGALRAAGDAGTRFRRWLDGMEIAAHAAQHHLDQIAAWSARADTVMAALSGRTPALLRATLAEWPLVSAPMAEELTGASRAAIQRNLAWMQEHDLLREVTGQGRFRMWRAAL